MGVKGRTVVQLAKFGCTLEVVMIVELLTHVAIHVYMVEKIVALENVMVLDHPKIGFTNKRLENGCRDVGVVIRPQCIANIVQQSADDIFIIPSIAKCAGSKFAVSGCNGLPENRQNLPSEA